jgi:hypothetical protein
LPKIRVSAIARIPSEVEQTAIRDAVGSTKTKLCLDRADRVRDVQMRLAGRHGDGAKKPAEQAVSAE